ncbi:MAG: MFS transporter [SAR202 cluster bacterium]|nr:MFS transporter [SAR202 cluster bacterium]MDP6714734.1 MFS transporter [SAR202 cluster bacterium]
MWLILRNPKFRLMWFVVLFDTIGGFSYFTATGWLALTLTNSPFGVGAIAGVFGLSHMLTSLFAGVVVDRMDKRTLIIANQILQVAPSFIIASLIFTDHIALWHLLALAFLRGMTGSVKITATRTLVLDVVGKADLLAANAATDAAFISAGILMPPVVGLMMEKTDIGWIYVLMGCAALLSALLLSSLRGVKSQSRSEQTSLIQDLKAGLRFVASTPIVRSLIILGLVGEIFAWSHEAMLPVMARDALEMGPTGLGYLYSAGSVGALIASVILSTRSDIANKGRLMMAGYIGLGVFLVLFSWSPWFLLSLFLLGVTHFLGVASFTILDTMLQTSVPDGMRGRVLSLQSFSFGLSNVTGFQTGAIAALLGAPVAITIGAGIVAAHGLRMLKGASVKFRDQQDAVLADE